MSSPEASGQTPATASPANTAAPQANTAAPPQSESPPPPPPSRAVAGWLVFTFVNITLFVFLVPDSILESKKVALLIKILPAVVAGGLFAAGMVWFKGILLALPERRSFRITNIVALGLLILLHVSQQDVVSIYPQMNTGGAKVKLFVDDKERPYEPGDKVRLSIGPHTIRVVPDNEGAQPQGGEADYPEIKEGQFRVTYKQVLCGLLGDYSPKWGPLYRVAVITPEANVEVLIHKTDGEFDAFFLENHPSTKLKYTFKRKPGSVNEFLYRGTHEELGSLDHLYLPNGYYFFTASREGCPHDPEKKLNIGIDTRPYTVSFKPLCEADQ